MEEGPSVKTAHWGEIIDSRESSEDEEPPDTSEIIENSMQDDCLDQYPDPEQERAVLYETCPQNTMNPLIMHAIELHKWMNNMSEIIKIAEMATEGEVIPAADAAIPIPECPDLGLNLTRTIFNCVLPKLPKEVAEIEVLELNEAVIKRVLRKCVATMTAHIGYQESFESVLDVLVDVLDDFLVKLCERFTSALTEEETFGPTGFPNVMEKVLVEMGLGGSKGLHDYHQNRVIKYVTVLRKRCKDLEKHYLDLSRPNTGPVEIENTEEIGNPYKENIKIEDETMELGLEISSSE